MLIIHQSLYHCWVVVQSRVADMQREMQRIQLSDGIGILVILEAEEW